MWIACLPLPTPDFRRPAALVVLKGESTGLTSRVCTWHTAHSPTEGCSNVTDGMPAADGIGVPEWSVFPLVLRSESPLWGDLFVACDGTKSRGATLRLPDLEVKWDATVEIVLDAPATQWGARPHQELAESEIQAAAAALCAGTLPVLPD